ncbi:MAG: nitroreductase family protein [Gemmatimonadales bacterium]|jgi:nitroreductase
MLDETNPQVRSRALVPAVAFLLGVLATIVFVSLRQMPDSPGGSVAAGEPSCDTGAVVLETIRHRRTVRSYRSAPVPREDLLSILDAARFAPTAGNQQPWTFLVVDDRERLDELRGEALEWYMERASAAPEFDPAQEQRMREGVAEALAGALSAPVYVAVLVDTTAPYPQYVTHDGTLAAGMLMVAARGLGYGTGFFTTFFPSDRMQRFLGFPDEYRLICFTPIGVPEAWPETPRKKTIEEVVVFGSFADEVG